MLSEAGSYLGLVLANTMNLLDIRDVVLGGHLALIADGLLPALKSVLVSNLLGGDGRSVKIFKSIFDHGAPNKGSIALALEAFQPLGAGVVLDE